MRKVKSNDELITRGNCIVFICDGQGSVGYTNYMEEYFIGSTTLSVGRNKYLNKYNGLFLVIILDHKRYRYSFGRKYKSNLDKAKIKLPAIIGDDVEKKPIGTIWRIILKSCLMVIKFSKASDLDHWLFN